MKRVLAIFLIFWLPLFMQSAWAMSTHMQVERESAMQMANMTMASDMPCHQGKMHGKQDHTPAQNTHYHQCVACAVVNASASQTSAPGIYLPAGHSVHFTGAQPRYLSIYLPPAIKPPIFS